ncbi:MAG: hypothetical protein HQL12_05815 [Candidatus Omnitrophica bacterium]|nr:hypothetical protein [Candidatus Omnitrophota bacterium]
MKRITWGIFILAFFLIRPYFMQANGMWYAGDDQDYFSHAFSLISGSFPSYANEFDYGSRNPLGSIGPGLMAAPFVFVFSFIDRIEGSDIFKHRNSENVQRSWSQFGFVFAASFYFWVACLLLYKGLRNYFSSKDASLSIILMVLIQGIPLFVYRRSIFTHAFEFFLQSLFVYLLLINHKKNQFSIEGAWKQIGIGLALGFLFLVRYNDFAAVLIWPFALYCRDRRNLRDPQFWGKIFIMYSTAILLILFFKTWPDILTNHKGYVGVWDQMTTAQPIKFYLKRFIHIFLGPDWGLIYSAPFILIALLSIFFLNFPIKRRLLLCLAPMLFNFYGVLMWRTQGCWYGYRYLIAAITPVLVFPLAHFLYLSQEKFGKKIFVFFVVAAVFPLFSMLCFEGNNTNLTMQVILQYFGREGWGNNTYQLEIWKTLFFQPCGFLMAIFKGGFLYFIYLISILFGLSARLPSMVIKAYPYFDISVLIKVSLLYAAPFIFYGVSKKLRLLSEDS